ncbi:hypothetical protein [Helicobacter sp. T3_23-1056]
MGWFDDFADGIKNGLKKAVDFVADGAKKGVDFVADGTKKFVDSCIMSMKNAIALGEYAWDSVTGLLSSDEAKKTAREINLANKMVANFLASTSFDKDKSSISSMKSLQDEINRFKNTIASQAEVFESELSRIGRECIDKLAQTLTQDAANDFKAQCELAFEKTAGSALNSISKKISLSDDKFVDILSLPNGLEKEEKIQDFIDKATQEGFRTLSYHFKEGITDNIAQLIKQLNNELEIRRTLSAKQMEFLHKIKEAGSVEQKQSEQANIACKLNKNIAILNAIKGV